MTLQKYRTALLFIFTAIACTAFGQSSPIQHDTQSKKITLTSGLMKIVVDYNGKANISQIVLNGQTVVDGKEGVFSRIKTKSSTYTTLVLAADPTVAVSGNVAELRNIVYGGQENPVTETWTFTVANDITFEIGRTVAKPLTAEQIALPVFVFSSTATWEGAYTDYGGLAWFYLFNKKLDTYGVHSSASRFWNSKTGNGFSISASAPENKIATTYSRTASDKLACSISLSTGEITPRFDADTYRRRFVRDTLDVWAPVALAAGTTREKITLSYFSFAEAFGRGDLRGINGEQVSAVLNTIARIGVIDKKHFGGNSWHTPYGPICLHEQYITQMGLAINDPNYLSGYQECLDFYRDNAITPEGRVWPRWAYTNEDMMPGKVTNKGFYEAQWGYLLDSNPDIVTNVVELYDQTGNLPWLKTHQASCEKALDWILKRDSDKDGLVEMITDSHTQKRGSDWIDIIWAAYENAFVNAKLYRALTLWQDAEQQLGNYEKATYYKQAAAQLKSSFNKSVANGGFWDDTEKCYVHWLDKDGSVHGKNMVTPVNFMAIGYGLCDDAARKISILDKIETQMEKEQLFFWPLCMTTYAPGEGNDWQFPFANYENGDLFLSWGALGVQVYADYKPALALKYVKNVLAQYAKDGLAFQRYGRAKQDGLGDDILSGNSLAVVGLYQAIYGINPMHNRFYLNPHITETLAGTSVRYNYQNQSLVIELNPGRYSVSSTGFKITAKTDFGFYASAHKLSFFNGSATAPSLTVDSPADLTLDIQAWTPEKIEWIQRTTQKARYQLHDNIKPESNYTVTVNNKVRSHLKSAPDGMLTVEIRNSRGTDTVLIENK